MGADRPLAGRVALVTGGGRGIGRATAILLAARGAAVAVNSVTETGEVVASEIEQDGGRAIALRGDVAETGQADRLVEATVSALGRLDVLINSAGTVLNSSVLETTDADWARLMAVNVGGSFACTRAAARAMIAAGHGGRIVNLSSAVAAIARHHRSAYGASKAAIEGFTRCAALDLAPYGITVNAVAPGLTETEMALNLLTPQLRTAFGHRFAAGRLARPEEIAAAIAFLASDESSYVTGAVIRVDGGWTSCDFDYRLLAPEVDAAVR